jgi:chemotaxis protein MotB
MGTTMSGTGETVTPAARTSMEQLKQKLEQEVKARKDLDKLSKQIEITITPEGLRIELLEDKNGTFYEIGSARLSKSGQDLLALLAGELKTLPNALLIEGHTDATPYSSDASYSNWELSADRANSARRLMQQDGVRGDQVTQVRGYADQLLRVKTNPNDPSNRRISILVKNNGAAPAVPPNARVTGGTFPPRRDAGSQVSRGNNAASIESNARSKDAAKGGNPSPPARPSTAKPNLVTRIKQTLPGMGK